MILKGKVCFITGSTRGIGWAAARVFAREGATVILNGRRAGSELEERCGELAGEFGAEAVGLAADAADSKAVKECYREIFRRFRRLDVLVNNAGILQSGLLGMIPEESIRGVIEVNLIGALIHMQEASRLMSRRQCGSIVNISSIVGRYGNKGQSVYAASKAGVLGMTLAAAKELAASGIRVNAVAPGFIDTALTRELPPAQHQAVADKIAMGRAGLAEEVAEAIAFLASDQASYITGQVLGVDGGMVI